MVPILTRVAIFEGGEREFERARRLAFVTKIMIDGSNLLDPLAMRRVGFEYISMGRV